MRELAIALVHFPVLDRGGAEIVTTVTNLDVHDIARSARTYGARAFYVVHPVEAQRTLIGRIQKHWTEGAGAKRIPDRSAALDIVRIVPAIEDVVRDLGAAELWTTAASAGGADVLGFSDARARLATDGPPVVLVLGTGWGLAPRVHTMAAARLAPIVGRGEWNHLSVRAACAIALDRLLGAVDATA